MDLSSLLNPLRKLQPYQRLCAMLGADQAVPGALHLPQAARASFAAALSRDLPGPVILLVSRSDRFLALLDELPAWCPNLRLLPFPEPNALFYEYDAWGARTLRQRAAALAALTEGMQPGGPQRPPEPHPTIVLATARSAMTRTLAMRDLLANSRWLHIGTTIRMDRLLKTLHEAGYEPQSIVIEAGQFSRRGGILDLWPPGERQPVRLEFMGDEIDSMRQFDPATQRSSQPLEWLRITPPREGLRRLFHDEWREMATQTPEAAAPETPPFEFFLPLMNPTPTGLLDFVPPQSTILVDDMSTLQNAVTEIEEQALALRQENEQPIDLPSDFPLPYLTLSEIDDALAVRKALNLGIFAQAPPSEELDFSLHFFPEPHFGGKLKPLMDHISRQQQGHETVVVVSRQAPRLAALWNETGAQRQVEESLPYPLMPGDLCFIHGALSEGWTIEDDGQSRHHLLTDAEIFGWARPRPRRRVHVKSIAPETAYADLQAGDWVVHVDYGIGRFVGLVERTIEDLSREYLLVAYAEGDQLYVPIHQADRITRYIGADSMPPELSRLGTQDWSRVKTRAQEAVEEVARDLLTLYARRQTVRGYAFPEDSEWQRELEASFPYEETEDQLQALEAVKHDMERPLPMDRLICGDAGYGKTEVALRAAFKAVLAGKQVCMLVPTTVLAQQHYDTFRQRLGPFPVIVEMLSRFRSRQEASAILDALGEGKIDIIIGTHRLLQKDVRFHDLGLLIIDEEQRFGVTHKEFLKSMRTEVDILTTTATPIPRTLYMALVGIRDISTINTPPEERLPPITHVGPYDPRMIRHAILREIDRNGQVFFVHNRVQTIERMHHRLADLLPEARMAVAHGQMPERQLSEVMERFNAGEIDVLLSTSIIESGLDIPNANTLIVDQADGFGLSQLYQLRGRVGRGSVRAYAYFFMHSHARATEEALLRLGYLAEHTQLGSGYSIAMHDLELRGAGEILGTRQHGHIAAIGFHLYTRLLGMAVRHLRAEQQEKPLPPKLLPEVEEPLAVSIELPLPISIPSDYVADRDLRLQLYRRMAGLRRHEDLAALASEMADRFGPLPDEVGNLLYQLRIKLLAHRAGVETILTENGQLLLQFHGEPPEALPDLDGDIRRSKRGLWVPARDPATWQPLLMDVLNALIEFQQASSK